MTAKMAKIRCSGCGVLFSWDDAGMMIHPEPWCLAMVSGEERPLVVE